MNCLITKYCFELKWYNAYINDNYCNVVVVEKNKLLGNSGIKIVFQLYSIYDSIYSPFH